MKERLATEKLYLESEIRFDQNLGEMLGESPAFQAVLKSVQIVAPTDATALILGETGTGKELVARAIHEWSGRNKRSFVRVNCATIPSSLLESELFGHEKGAFTGALAQRIGRFELAHQGTLFLDEIGEIPLELQNVIERSVVLTRGSVLELAMPEISAGLVAAGPKSELASVAERERIVQALKDAKGVVAGPNGAARLLGLKRTTLQARMKKLRITRDYQ
jgi:transcriptional regulator with GAF, ATPase, and Fis domain